MPKITLYFTDSEFDKFVANNPQFLNVENCSVKTKRKKESAHLSAAKNIILDALRDGINAPTEIAGIASLLGIGRATLHRAKVALGVVSTIKRKPGGGRLSTWALPK